MGIFEFFRCRPQYHYSAKEIQALETYIEQQYGKIESVFHEKKSPDIHLDIYLINPTQDAPCYKLVTVGVGAYQMNVPQDLRGLGMDRAELVLFLPPDWNVRSADEVYYWPFRLMKQVGRLPISCKTWIGEGHSISSDTQEPYAKNTKQNGCLLLNAQDKELNQMSVLLPGGKKIRFYNILPLYQEEMQFKLDNGSAALIDRLIAAQIGLLIDPERVNVCK